MLLSPGELRTLVDIVVEVPVMQSMRGRQQTLVACGLGARAHEIDFSEPTRTAVTEILLQLDAFGRSRAEASDLGVFLNWMMSMLGVNQQATVRDIVTAHAMMAPIAVQPDVTPLAPPPQPDDESVLEKLIGENNLRPVAFLEEALRVARAVAYVGLARGSGSGFLVAEDLLMTNFHVLPSRADADRATFRFNFQNDWRGRACPHEELLAKRDGLFFSDRGADVAVVEVEDLPGRRWGYLPVVDRPIERNARINVIQHPGGQHKQISIQNNLVEYVDDDLVHYVTTTLPGSSGSPVFNDSWEVVAVHHAGGHLVEPTTRRRAFRNEGIRVAAVLRVLPAEIRARLGAAA